MAYTPFIERNMGKIADAIDQSTQRKLAQSAYMGDASAMGELSARNPQLAQQIQQGQMRDQQMKLQEASRQSEIGEANRAKLTEIAKNIAMFDNFDEARAYAQEAASAAGISAPPLDESHFSQFKKVYGDRISKLDQAKLDIQRQSPKNSGEMSTYQQQQIDIANRRLDQQKMSAFAEKEIGKASDDYNTATSSSSRYKALASRLEEAAAIKGGVEGTWGEWIKEQTGNQDELTALRKEALQIASSEAINNLPPGAASESDVRMARAPLPTEKADPKYVAEWLGAIARLRDKEAEYYKFKADFIGQNRALATKDGKSLASAWKEINSAPIAKPELSGVDAEAYEWATDPANANKPQAAAILQKLGVQ